MPQPSKPKGQSCKQLAAQASATMVARTMTSGMGSKRVRDVRNPEDYAHRVFKKKGKSLPVEPQCMQHPGQTSLKTWYVSPQQWVEHIMSSHPELLAGPGRSESEENLTSFWSAYRFAHGHHSVFSSHLETQLHRVLPLLLHGDEGRGAKKGKCCVLSLQSMIGSLPEPHPKENCDCAAVLQKGNLPVYGIGDEEPPYCLTEAVRKNLRRQATNYPGSTFISRWLLFSLGSWVYKPHPEILSCMIERLAADLSRLFVEGVHIGNQVYYGAIVGVKGDLDWHRQAYELFRSYSHVGTLWTGPICHACEAGGQGPMFEDYSEAPAWAATLYSQRPFTSQPALSTLPAFPAPEELIQLDPFHVVKMGVGRSIAGGVLVYLARHRYFDHEGSTTNFKDRLARAHGSFTLFCTVRKKYPSLRSFTKEFLNMKTLRSAPWTATKGSDTMLVIRWLIFFLRLALASPPGAGDATILRTMLRVCEATCASMRIMHTHALWLSRPCARRLYVEYMRMLRGYQVLGSRCLAINYRAFIQKPKNHAAHHIAYALRMQLISGAPFILSPEAFSCEQDEDYIGRVSRLSRKVDVRKQGQRIFQRLFLKVFAVRKRWLFKKREALA